MAEPEPNIPSFKDPVSERTYTRLQSAFRKAGIEDDAYHVPEKVVLTENPVVNTAYVYVRALTPDEHNDLRKALAEEFGEHTVKHYVDFPSQTVSAPMLVDLDAFEEIGTEPQGVFLNADYSGPYPKMIR